jgi:uncharacterized repeat protein (TIGR04138 family)
VIELRLAPDILAKIHASESRYHELGYLFVLESVEFLQRRLTVRRHVTAAELAIACRDWALEQYGLLAKEVLAYWGITQSRDIGRIVFTLVDVSLLVTQPGDREEDFEGLFDFNEALGTGYVWPGMRSGELGGEQPQV